MLRRAYRIPSVSMMMGQGSRFCSQSSQSQLPLEEDGSPLSEQLPEQLPETQIENLSRRIKKLEWDAQLENDRLSRVAFLGFIWTSFLLLSSLNRSERNEQKIGRIWRDHRADMSSVRKRLEILEADKRTTK